MNYKLWIMNYELQQVIPDKVSESEKTAVGLDSSLRSK